VLCLVELRNFDDEDLLLEVFGCTEEVTWFDEADLLGPADDWLSPKDCPFDLDEEACSDGAGETLPLTEDIRVRGESGTIRYMDEYGPEPRVIGGGCCTAGLCTGSVLILNRPV
jgi:hypothetical protein